NPDGTGSVTMNLEKGGSFTFVFVMTEGGLGLQLAATGCSGDCEIGGNTLVSGTARVAYAGPMKGSYGITVINSPKPALNMCVVTLDETGNAGVSQTFVGLSGTNGQPAVFTGTQPGTYSLKPDGIGTVSLDAVPGFSNALAFAMVATDGGSGFF